MKLTYAVIMSEGPNNWNAYSPDVQGCVAAGDTHGETLNMYAEALIDHLELSAEHGDPIPLPKITAVEEALAADATFGAEIAAEYPDDPTDEEEGWSPPIVEMIDIEVTIPQSALPR